MSFFFAFLLLCFISQTFTQNLPQGIALLNNFQPNNVADQRSNSPITESNTENDGNPSDETGLNNLNFSPSRIRNLFKQRKSAADQQSNNPITGPNNENDTSPSDETGINDLNLSPTRTKLMFKTRKSAPDQQSNSPASGLNTNNDGNQQKETDLNSPLLSKFASYNLKISEDSGIYPFLFNVSLSPDDVRETFYNEAVYLALDNGLYEVGDLPQQLADAAIQAFPNLTPSELFKVTSNTLELILQNAGLATEGNYQILVRLNAKAVEDAMHKVKVKDAQSAFHAIIVGANVFLKSLSVNSPDDIRYAIATYADQLTKVPTNRGFQ